MPTDGQRYMDAFHAVVTGIADPATASDLDPKALRQVEVAVQVSNTALVNLLEAKGVFMAAELLTYQANSMEGMKSLYETKVGHPLV